MSFRLISLFSFIFFLSGCALVTIGSSMEVEPVTETVEVPVFLDSGNCPTYFQNVVDDGQPSVQALFEESMDEYEFERTASKEQADFLLSFSCSGSTKPERKDANGVFVAPSVHMLSLGLIPVSESFPRAMALKVIDLRSGQAELVDENVQEGVTKNYHWSIFLAPVVMVDSFISDSGAYSDAITQSVEGLLSQAINDYVFE